MPVTLDGQPVAVDTPIPQMPNFNLGSVDMMDVSAFDGPIATIFGSDYDATQVGLSEDPAAANDTGYVPRSFLEPAVGGSTPPEQGSVAPPSATPPSQPHTLPQPAPTQVPPAQATPTEQTPVATPDVATLQQELEALKSVKEYVDTPEYQNARVVAEQFEKDPVTFIQQFLPHVVEQLGIRQAVQTTDNPQEFARSFMEQKLTEKYGEQFQYNPQDAGFRGTDSYNYETDRQLLLQEGFSTYYGEKQRVAAQQQQQQAQAMQAATKAGSAYGLSPDEVHQALTALDAEQNANPMETYYDMLFTWMAARGRITPRQGQPAGQQPNAAPVQPVNPNSLPRRPESVPSPSVAQTPAGSSEPLNAVVQRFAEDFPLDYLMQGSGF